MDACNRYYYPNTTVLCGEGKYHDLDGHRSLTNPSLIVEVLSDSTELIDRGNKWQSYSLLDSLDTYVLIAQNTARVEVLTRREGGDLRLSTYRGIDSAASLSALDCNIELADICANVHI